jgi:ubiquinone biosynthesis monooxygenase Coq7
VERNYSQIDRIISAMDDALRLSTGSAPEPARSSPAGDILPTELGEEERLHVAGLMRINHAGEICAQALYAGQAATARDDSTREAMQQAADDEIDHLAWCEERLEELDSRPSILNPLWYAGSFAIGALAGIAGDQWSLGFVKETEKQVEAHLEEHIDRLPSGDARSQAILDQMKADEARHAEMAEPVRKAMAFTAGFMKALAYRL